MNSHPVSIKQFLECNTLAEFAPLDGDPAGQEKVEKIRDKPAIYWTHPSTFNVLGEKENDWQWTP
jgi:hypothetical protein